MYYIHRYLPVNAVIRNVTDRNVTEDADKNMYAIGVVGWDHNATVRRMIVSFVKHICAIFVKAHMCYLR